MALQRAAVRSVPLAVCCISRYNWIILVFQVASLIMYALWLVSSNWADYSLQRRGLASFGALIC